MLIKDVIRDREPYSMKAKASAMEAAEFIAPLAHNNLRQAPNTANSSNPLPAERSS